jgi:hypothetical protein
MLIVKQETRQKSLFFELIRSNFLRFRKRRERGDNGVIGFDKVSYATNPIQELKKKKYIIMH